eukprot:TRINITY_DN942_c0_g5_i1.p1 TRINITY_DN942_c0_g5~~TRINITY_DN942_c0_g5_i1.p1  ORF type:complete len:2507 (-),score=267.64 TRINITY_DN942_c0_g5_i1:79-6945(-)
MIDEGLAAVAHPVCEIVLVRDYQGALAGVLEQVELLKVEHSVDTEMDYVGRKAALLDNDLFDPESELQSFFASLGQALPDLHKKSTSKIEPVEPVELGEPGGPGEPGESGELGEPGDPEKAGEHAEVPDEEVHKEVDAKTARKLLKQQEKEERKAEKLRAKERKKMQKLADRYAKRFTELTQRREKLEERMLEIETDRSMHADMMPEERDVLRAYVIFWCHRARDDVLNRYNGCCRSSRGLKFDPEKVELEADDEDDNSGPQSEKYKIKVRLAPEPSLLRWENVDIPFVIRCALRARRCLTIYIAFPFIMALACFLIVRPLEWPSFVYTLVPAWSSVLDFEEKAYVWLIANVSAPTDSDCWKICEVEFFEDEACSTKWQVDYWVSSNGLDLQQDAGLGFLSDHNFVQGYTCRGDWRPRSCWDPLKIANKSCSRRLRAQTEQEPTLGVRSSQVSLVDSLAHGSFKERDQHSMTVSADPIPSFQESTAETPHRRLSGSSTCYWPSLGTFNSSTIDLRVTWQASDDQRKKAARLVEDAVRTQFNAVTQDNMDLLTSTLRASTFEAFPNFTYTPPAKGMCIDRDDAASYLKAAFNISDEQGTFLRSCADFARFGLFGVDPICGILPAAWRDLCPMTCGCRCSALRPDQRVQVPADCTAPGGPVCANCLFDGLRPASGPALVSISVWEQTMSVCVTSGAVLQGLTCGEQSSGYMTLSSAALSPLWTEGVYPIMIKIGVPQSRSCSVVSRCKSTEIDCRDRYGDSICAVVCDGVEQCIDGADEVLCRECLYDLSAKGDAPVAELRCNSPPGRCVDIDVGYEPCRECSTDVNASTEPQCLLPQLNSVGGSSQGQCDPAVLSPVFAIEPTCDPENSSYAPCACLASTRTNRSAFGCLIRGDLQDALMMYPGLLMHFKLDSLVARKSPNAAPTTQDYVISCTMWGTAEGLTADSSACSLTEPTVIVVSVFAANFDGSSWFSAQPGLHALPRNASGSKGCSHTFEVWLMPKCTSCAIAQLPNDGVLYLDASGKVAVKPGKETSDKALSGGTTLAEEWHFIAHSCGPQKEILLVDGSVVAERSASDAEAAGWTLATTNITLGFAPVMQQGQAGVVNSRELAIYQGYLDEAALFEGALSAEALRHHMMASSWRGVGPTFAERFHASACFDQRESAENSLCASEIEQWFEDNATQCSHGVYCDCLQEALQRWGVAALTCRVGCGAARSRSILNVLRQLCADDTVFTKACLSTADCEVQFPKLTNDKKMECDLAQQRCVPTKDFIQSNPYHFLKGSICVARNQSLTKLNSTRAHEAVGALLQLNGSQFTTMTIVEGCDLAKSVGANVSTRGLLGFNGSTSLLFPAVTSPDKNGNSTFVSAEGWVQFAGGFQTITFQTEKIDDGKAFETLASLQRTLSMRGGAWTPDDPDAASFEDIPCCSPPNMTVKMIYDPLTDAAPALALMHGIELDILTEDKGVLCSASEYQCEPGVCVACPANGCLCDLRQQCPNGQDEDFNLDRNNISTECRALAAKAWGDSPCKGDVGVEYKNASGNASLCLPEVRHCDNVPDVNDSSDENVQTCPTTRATPLTTWVAAGFYSNVSIKCVRVHQPAEAPARLMGIFKCDRKAILTRSSSHALFDAAAGCVRVGSINFTGNITKGSASSWGVFHPDSIAAEGAVTTIRCPLGADLRDDELISFGAAYLAFKQAGPRADPTVTCFCEQRLQIEPTTYTSLPPSDLRYRICSVTIERLKMNMVWSYARTGFALVMQIFFVGRIRFTIHLAKHMSYIQECKDHFKTLWARHMTTMIIPACVNIILPTREWLLYVGIMVLSSLLFRVIWPHALDFMKFLFVRPCVRRRKARTIYSQELMNELYTNPQFRLGEGLSDMTYVFVLSCILAPVIPAVNFIAAAALLLRYICDFITFLRGCSRPPFYDERVLYPVINCMLLGCIARCLMSIVVFLDVNWVDLSIKSDQCGFDATNTERMREAEASPVYWISVNLYRIINNNCTDMWILPALVGGAALAAYLVLRYSPELKLCKCGYSNGTGKTYDEITERRNDLQLLNSYDPRQSLRYQSAFKLLDLYAKHDSEATSEEHGSSSDSEEHEEKEWEPSKGWDHHAKLDVGGKKKVVKSKRVEIERKRRAKELVAQETNAIETERPTNLSRNNVLDDDTVKDSGFKTKAKRDKKEKKEKKDKKELGSVQEESTALLDTNAQVEASPEIYGKPESSLPEIQIQDAPPAESAVLPIEDGTNRKSSSEKTEKKAKKQHKEKKEKKRSSSNTEGKAAGSATSHRSKKAALD